jgi:predicted nucleic acid-binding protein
MKSPVFIDTGYILALVNTADQYHQQARTAASRVAPPFVTTEAVLTEVGNALAKVHWRQLGVATLKALRTDANIEIVPVDAALFDRAVQLYSSRSDKEWGLTSCISFVVMQERNLQQVLTTDRHFEQAEFQNVLADT